METKDQGKRKAIEESQVGAKKAKGENDHSIAGLGEDQKQVLKAVQEGRNVFFTGSAGTGKKFSPHTDWFKRFRKRVRT